MELDCINGDSINVHDISTGPIDTGLVDVEGLPIYRVPFKVGFILCQS